MNVGSVEYYLNLIDGSGEQVEVNVTGHWTGTGHSTEYSGCVATLDVNLVQSGNSITGSGSMSGNCLDGTESGNVAGTLSGSSLTFGLAYDAASSIAYQGTVAGNQVSVSGSYDWPGEVDEGTWVLNRQ